MNKYTFVKGSNTKITLNNISNQLVKTDCDFCCFEI